MTTITKKDLIILSYFRQNARLRLTKLSRATGIPVSTLFDKFNSYQQDIVYKTVSLLNFGAIGFGTRANVLLRVGGKDKDNLKKYLYGHLSVNSLYKINNGYDFLVECVFRSIRELEEFIDQLRADFDIKSNQVYYIVDDLKREAFLADPALVDFLVQKPKTAVV